MERHLHNNEPAAALAAACLKTWQHTQQVDKKNTTKTRLDNSSMQRNPCTLYSTALKLVQLQGVGVCDTVRVNKMV